MAIVHLGDMLRHAALNSYTVGGFRIDSLGYLSAVLAAAEVCRAPVILNIAYRDADHLDLETLTIAAEHAGARAAVPVGIHFDRAGDLDSAVSAIRWGCNSVGFDGSKNKLPENISNTQRAVDMLHCCGVAAEGLVGRVFAEPNPDPSTPNHRFDLTSADEARAFASRTNVDFVAVTAAMNDEHDNRKCKLDFQRIARIKTTIGQPLVVHGGSNIGEDHLRRLSRVGVAKVNFNVVRGVADRERSGTPQANAQHATQQIVENLLRALSSAGRAAEVSLRCRSWCPVDHVILFNLGTNTSFDVVATMAQGRRVLSQIPGVRSVSTGTAVQDRARYQFCWLVKFASRAVIDSYRDHPVHKKFADELFRPIAADRISIDFECLTSMNQGPFQAPSDQRTSSLLDFGGVERKSGSARTEQREFAANCGPT